jgi:choline dehydrogenase-like flavoprotein
LLAGGALQTPQLLMLSGVGNANALQSMGIPVVHDLPGVGQNLQDHPDFVFKYRAKSLDLLGVSAAGSCVCCVNWGVTVRNGAVC